MCGIVGVVAERNSVPILVEGLRRLEYRGYDSAGIAVLNGGRASRLRTRANQTVGGDFPDLTAALTASQHTVELKCKLWTL
jgi:glutamine phosphoribosylpyrophosphate amidotransferase